MCALVRSNHYSFFLQVVSEKINQNDLAIDDVKMKYPSKHVCASQLLEVMKEQHVEPFVQGFHLAEQISLVCALLNLFMYFALNNCE